MVRMDGTYRPKEFSVTSIRMKDTGIAIEGEFDLPALAKLSDEDQVFVGHLFALTDL